MSGQVVDCLELGEHNPHVYNTQYVYNMYTIHSTIHIHNILQYTQTQQVQTIREQPNVVNWGQFLVASWEQAQMANYVRDGQPCSPQVCAT